MKKNINLTAGLAAGALVLSVVAFPGIAAAVQAQDSGTTTVNVNVGSQITLSNGNTTVNINPTLGTTGTAVQTLTVTTNNTTGYLLQIEMNSINKSLLSGANAITATTNGTTAAALQNDTWGYNFGTTNVAASTFLTIPTQGTPSTIASSSTTANAVATYVTFGAQPTASLPSGTYTGEVLYTAVVNP
ncbi:hypothetical protein FWF93_02140 [Candidatus Saccharibacteria bacterium]|jgi:hypothetical protein|nr:hypothetical protein [Candidatus Saccharibacteria bacterium]